MHEAVLRADQAAIYIPYEPLKLIGASIIALVPIGYQPIIDTQVPDLHNYKAAGVYHHNCGKTMAAANALAIMLTGEYPKWWKGRRWDRPIACWVGGVTAESTRDAMQRLLMGRPGQYGTGAIPADMIISQSSARGVADALDTVQIKHVSGGVSTLTFKAYKDGREKWQAETLDVVAFDEEPPLDIYVEGLTRTNATGGIAWLTFTPLLGMSQVATRFFEEESPDRNLVSMTIFDVEHYTPEQRERIIASYPGHEREARASGVPTLGSGRVFPVAEEVIKVPAFSIPKHWPRICGVDFGYDHPSAAAWLAWDRDSDTIYLYDVYKVREATPMMQAPAIRAKGAWIPVAWPHDGLQHDKGSGIQLAEQYRAAGLNMLLDKATHAPVMGESEGSGGNGLEAGVSEMLDRMQSGRWKVFDHLNDWFAEFRQYHRKNGQIVKLKDDAISASRYGMMMKRFAMTEPGSNSLKGQIISVNFGARKGGY
jgi:phage terminase large subunit-like protein